MIFDNNVKYGLLLSTKTSVVNSSLAVSHTANDCLKTMTMIAIVI